MELIWWTSTNFIHESRQENWSGPRLFFALLLQYGEQMRSKRETPIALKSLTKWIDDELKNNVSLDWTQPLDMTDWWLLIWICSTIEMDCCQWITCLRRVATGNCQDKIKVYLFDRIKTTNESYLNQQSNCSDFFFYHQM